MGYIRHHVILVTTWDEGELQKAHDEAVTRFDKIAPVGPILPHPINGGGTFLVAPDGSKEGWDHSDDGDAARNRFVAWLAERHLYWAEVCLGQDEPDDTAIVRKWAWREEEES